MRKAFTLIELLVVIAIIAILAAILFPVFASAKLAAKGTMAVSNIKQMGISFMLYAGDVDDMMPLAAYGTATKFLLWHDLIDPYLKNKEVWRCPGSTVKNTDASGAFTTHWGYNVQYLTTFKLDFSNANAHTAVSVTRPDAPSETVMLTSARASILNNFCGDDGKFLLAPSGPTAPCWGRPDWVFQNQAIVQWMDTHANKRSTGQFYSGQTPVDKFFDLAD